MIRKPGVGVVDYGSGNVASLWQTLRKIGYRPTLLRKAEDFDAAKVIIIPGVGAFPQAMDQLRASGFDKLIMDASQKGKRIVGICLGMQILAEKGLEIRPVDGLGLIPGTVRAHPEGLQVGWMALAGESSRQPDFDGQHVYFNHYFYLETESSGVLYNCADAELRHPAIVRKDNVIGIQFHPEKSQQYGLDILGRAIRGEIE